MLYIVLSLAFLAAALFIAAFILVAIFRKTHKYSLYISHRAAAICGAVVALAHGFFAYNFFIHKFF
jgi:hypothetical protein